MAVEGKMTIIKYLMFFFNFLFWLSGVALIVVGGYLRDKYGEYLTFADNKYSDAAIFLIIVGVIVFIIGFLGCCGAIKENYCMVTTFAVLLTLIFILELAAGILGFVYKGEVKKVSRNAVRRGFDEYATQEGAKDFFDFVQKELKCCGYSGPGDWSGSNTTSAPTTAAPTTAATTAAPTTSAANNNGTSAPTTASPTQAPTAAAHGGIPDSCCKNPPCTTQSSYKDGCEDKFEVFLKDKLLVIGGVGIGIAFIQILGIVFACLLMRSIKGEYEVV